MQDAVGGGANIAAAGLASASATTTLGAIMPWVGVAFLVGSWLFGGFSKQKNTVIDPGAQEMPRFNQALRGTTQPVLFGTNKVSSQIIWMKNFTTIRSKNTTGGGKFGGSGKGMPSTVEYTYEYKWDMIFHFGLTDGPYNLFRAWLGADEIDPNDIAAITFAEVSGSGVLTGFGTGALTGSDYISIKADEVVYFPGNRAETNTWAHFTSEEGYAIRWPGSAWLGIKQLSLGSQAHVPQLQVEIGPGSVTLDFDSGFVGRGEAQNVGGSAAAAGVRSLDLMHNKYMVVAIDNNASAETMFEVWDVTTGTVKDYISYSDMQTEADASYGAGTYTLGSRGFAVPVARSNYVLTGGTLGVSVDYVFVLWEVGSDGTVTAKGTWICGGNTEQWISSTFAALCNDADDADPILLVYYNAVNTDELVFEAFPSPVTFALRGGSFANNRVSFDTGSLMGEYFGHNHTNQGGSGAVGWVVPKISALGAYTTRLYFFFNYEYMHINEGSAFENSYLRARYDEGYTDGIVVYWDLGAVSAQQSFTLSVPTIANDDFVDTGGAPVIPFDDDYMNINGVRHDPGVDGIYEGSNYSQQPTVQEITSGPGEGAFAVLFAKNFQPKETLAAYGYHYVKAVAFVYNPLDGSYTQYAEVSGGTYHLVNDLGGASTNNHTPWDHALYWNQSTGKVYEFVLAISNNASIQVDRIFSELGDLTISGGDDVFPPYIIKTILTDTYWGMGLSESLIDTTTYNTAVEYCRTEDIKVSVQYRREQSILSIFEEILAVYGGYLVWSDGKIKFGIFDSDDAANPVRTIDNSHLISDNGPPIRITPGARQDTVNQVKVNYIDRELDYYQNQVIEGDEVDQDLNGLRAREFPPVFVMSEATARKMASRALWANLYSRRQYEYAVSWKDADLEPGDVITLVDSYAALNDVARIVRIVEKERGVYEHIAVQELAYAYSSSPGINSSTIINSVGVVGRPVAPQAQAAYELPAEFQTTPEMYAGWVSGGNLNVGAKFYASPDNLTYAEVDDAQPYPIGGQFRYGLPNRANAGVVFEQNVEVLLFPASNWTATSPYYVQEDTLPNVTLEGAHLGQLLLWCGSEMMMGYAPVQVSQNWYRLTRLYRGWGGTHIHDHSSGAFWHQHGAGILDRDYTQDQIGTAGYYKVAPYNAFGQIVDLGSVQAGSYTIAGAYYRPQHAGRIACWANSMDNRGNEKISVASTVDVPLLWKFGSRLAGYGAGGNGSGTYGRYTIDTLSYSWRVEVVGSGGVVVRSTTVDTPYFMYTSSMNFADNGAWRGTLGFKVTPFNDNGDAPRTSVLSVELF